MERFKAFRLPVVAAGILALVASCGESSPLGVQDTGPSALTKRLPKSSKSFVQTALETYSASNQKEILDTKALCIN